MTSQKADSVKRGISLLQETLQCPICLELMTTPVFTKCDHQFCKFCMVKLLDSSKQNKVNCPVCKTELTKRSLQDSPWFHRLVEGIQNLVQAYENDTGIKYFTGPSQPMIQMSLKETELNKTPCTGADLSSGEKSVIGLVSCEADGTNVLLSSQSFTNAAKDDFTRLMGLDDSCAITSENDVLDSGLGDALTISEKESNNCNGGTLTTNKLKSAIEPEKSDIQKIVALRQRSRGKRITNQSDNVPTCPVFIPEEEEFPLLRRSSRKDKQKKLDPVTVLNNRQRKSVVQVTEWLMKVQPAEADSQMKKNDEATSDSGDSAGYSVHSTVMHGNQEDKSVGKWDGGKGLEKRVFGAVYRRDRSGKIPRHKQVVNPPIRSKRAQNAEKNSTSSLTPADVAKTLSEEDRQYATESVKDETFIILKEPAEPEFIHLTDKKNSDGINTDTEEFKEIPVKDKKRSEEVVDSPVFDVPLRLPGRKTRKIMKGTWKEVDCDLQGQADAQLANTEKKTTGKKTKENAKCKAGKVPKPLVLVGVTDGETVSKSILGCIPTLIETEVQIESYPSSEDPGSQVSRANRRSKRLQLFTEEVQGSHRKACKQESTSLCTGHAVPQPSVKEMANVQTDTIRGSQSRETGNPAKNSCIYTENISAIEIVESCERTPATRKTAKIENPVKESVVAKPSNRVLCEADSTCSVMVAPCSDGSIEAIVPCSTHEDVSQTTPAIMSPCVEMEDDRINDSDGDTEQLVKSFKATKRKSFCFGSPTTKRFCLDSDKENVALPEAYHKSHTAVNVEAENELGFSNSKHCSFVQQGLLKELDNSCISDVVTYEDKKHKMSDPKPDPQVVSLALPDASGKTKSSSMDLFSDNSGNSVALLSHNKPSIVQLDNSHSSTVLQLARSGQLFPIFGASPEDSPNLIPVASEKSQTTQYKLTSQLHGSELLTPKKSKLCKRLDVATEKSSSANIVGKMPHSEGSLTPDGLVPQTIVAETNKPKVATEWSEPEAQSPVVFNKRKRASRLQSSSESGSSDGNEELLSLDQLLRPSTRVPALQQSSACLLQTPVDKQESSRDRQDVAGVDADAAEGQPRSEWVNDSQGSVDLFGTPAECDPAVFDTVFSAESSQYSGEILATQQRIAMKEKLLRLEEMMALVSEALQEKEQKSQRAPVVTAGPGPVEPQQAPVGTAVPGPMEPQQAPVGTAGSGPVEPQRAPVGTAGSGPVEPQRAPVGTAGSGLVEPQRAPVGTAGSGPVEPQPPSPPDHWAGYERHSTLPCGQVAREATLDERLDVGSPPPASEASDSLGPTQPSLPKQGGSAEAAQQATRESRSLLQSDATKSSAIGSEDIAESNAPNKLRASFATRQEPRELTQIDDPHLSQRKDTHLTQLDDTHTSKKGSHLTTLVLVPSGLGPKEQVMVKRFARWRGGSVSSQVTAETTHVIISTDDQLVCQRTLKYFLGIAGRKWVVSFDWITESLKQGEPLEETLYEVRGDVVNGANHQGPMRARTTSRRNLLMKGYSVCFQGPYSTAMTIDQMEWMAEQCGAAIVKDPLHLTGKKKSHQLVIVQQESDISLPKYRALHGRAIVLTRGWLLDTVSTYTLQNHDNYGV